MRFLKPIDLALLFAAVKAVSYSNWFVYGADAPQGRSVSLLFENDGVWVNFARKPSALLFHDALTSKEAAQVCRENNETLLSRDMLSDFANQLSYFQSIGQIQQQDLFWLSSDNSDAVALSFQEETSPNAEVDASSAKHPFLCTNSAPHTVKVDTDFSSSPKTIVTSGGTTFTGTRDHLSFRFMGIPYAQPPVGDLRFRLPEKFNGTSVDATTFKPACLQFGDFGNNDEGLNPWGVSEDCLILNLYTPFIPGNSSSDSTQLKPVLFWIHGGGNTVGTGSDSTFDGGPLVSRGDVVVVSINYRLDIFGFLAFDDGVITGNYALADRILALEWVKENIAAFGGDPNQVMIFGQSAGGGAVIDLLRSSKAAGLFHTAISHSGGSSSATSQQQAGANNERVISQFCNSTGEERLQCLQALPAETLLNITNTLPSWGPVLDGVFVTEDPITQIGRGPGAVNSVPFITGFMPEEGQALFGTAVAPNATDLNASITTVAGAQVARAVVASGLWEITDEFTVYNATVDVVTDRLSCAGGNLVHTAAKSQAFPALYVYKNLRAYALSFLNRFGLCTFPVGKPQPYYRCHSGDLYEIFGTYYLFDQPPRVPEDFFFTVLLQDLWVSFARTGNPNPSLDFLKSRGPAYESTIRVLEETGWVWPEFAEDKETLAALDYPDLGFEDGLPDDRNGRCAVLSAAGRS